MLVTLTVLLLACGIIGFLHKPPGDSAVILASPAVSPTASLTPEPSASPSIAPVTSAVPKETESPAAEPEAPSSISEDTRCDDKACVALYIHTYKKLPSNYMTKKEARRKGWRSGALSRKIKGMCIGGDRYTNAEEILPVEWDYLECDINTIGKKKRGTERIVYSTDGELIYYTPDHYETFELMYGEEDPWIASIY